MKKYLLAGLGLLVLCAAALAQTAQAPVIHTNDLIQIVPNGAASAQAQFATPAQIAGVPGYVKTVPLTAFSLTFANSQVWFLIVPAGTLATGTFTTAPNPSDGQRECVRSTQTQTAVTITANTGQTMNGAITAMTANTSYCWTYVAAEAVWYQS